MSRQSVGSKNACLFLFNVWMNTTGINARACEILLFLPSTSSIFKIVCESASLTTHNILPPAVKLLSSSSHHHYQFVCHHQKMLKNFRVVGRAHPSSIALLCFLPSSISSSSVATHSFQTAVVCSHRFFFGFCLPIPQRTLFISQRCLPCCPSPTIPSTAFSFFFACSLFCINFSFFLLLHLPVLPPSAVV